MTKCTKISTECVLFNTYFEKLASIKNIFTILACGDGEVDAITIDLRKGKEDNGPSVAAAGERCLAQWAHDVQVGGEVGEGDQIRPQSGEIEKFWSKQSQVPSPSRQAEVTRRSGGSSTTFKPGFASLCKILYLHFQNYLCQYKAIFEYISNS